MSTIAGADLAWPDAPCCAPHYPAGCVCPAMERALRAWNRGEDMPPMTDQQREACLTEISRVEGFTRADGDGQSDDNLACVTLTAWLYYARDKGLVA